MTNPTSHSATSAPRYALYFAPITSPAWWTAGSRWLGRDAATNVSSSPPEITGCSPLACQQLTADARRYGFHATLKAPFRLAQGFSENDLVAMAQAFSLLQTPLPVKEVGIHLLGNFLALQTMDPLSKDQISALAMRCVTYFDLLRAAPSAAELAKRQKADLTPRQTALNARWGYPYTEEEYRFHLTLTHALTTYDDATVAAIRATAETCFAQALTTLLIIDGLSIFKESEPGAPMTVWKHFPFLRNSVLQQDDAMHVPVEGRLFFVVGPSGVGKDTLLQWVQPRLPESAGIVFAQRSVTRAAHASEAHESMTRDDFFQAAEMDEFSMAWQANDTHYGIRRGVEATLKAGCDVIVNGSRQYIPQLRALFPQAQIIWISADAQLIRQRIEKRQRETGAALESRLLRSAEFSPEETIDGDGMMHIDNSGPIEVAGHQLLAIFSTQH
ncbi:phosphonate metabolism protein/1,5-bisphosphokinase (PRPP-forming) PhnN [Glaciimonas sp. GG7]